MTRSFMDAEPDKRLLATIPAGGSYSFAYSDADHVAVGESVVYFAEFSAENASDGQDAGVLVSHVVTTADKTDPAPYAATPTIARTNATADRSDDYRGVLDHWGRTGTIDLTLTNDNPFLGLRLGDQGYSGEQEKLYTRWNVKGEPVEKQEVRFVTPTINKVRLAYWYIDYDVQVHLKNQTGYPVIHTLYGSNGTNPGFVNYQLNDGPANNYHFARNTVVPVTTEKEYRLRMMVMPSAYLPYGLYFAAGTPDGVPNELVVSKAEYSLLAADAGQAEELVNKLPEGPEKAALTARLAQVREWISAEAAVSAAESRLQELAATLQTVDLSPAGKAERDSLRQQLEDGAALVQEALTAAASTVEALPQTDSSALKEHLADFRSRLAAAEGRLEAVQTIADQALQPGNRFGDADLSLHKKVGETASLNELAAGQAQPLPVQGPFTWVGSDTAVATVTPDGVLTAVREGSALVYGYNGQGMVAVLVHVGD
ncbi:hypothetical protein N6H14_04220 [Paenibacillus sp. CC-CFT747]|nr:hypothetical protein N6H14_04220 [Paenibacillus sp. CC-CFT747]